MSINDSKSMDCKYCVSLGTDSKTKTPFYCKIKHHNVSKKSCIKCDKRVYLNQMSIDNKKRLVKERESNEDKTDYL